MSPPLPHRCSLVLALLAIAFGGAAAQAADDKPSDGATIYKNRCASCHGPRGEGVKDEHPEPLIGDRSIPDLTRLIAKTMPKHEEGTCTGADAEKVAAYIHDAFYSPTAQVRNKPPRIELARLTVRQYRNAITDLVMGARLESLPTGEPGLKGEYFKSRNFRNQDRYIDRVDAQVKFDFGDKAPEPEKNDSKEFCIRWEGSVQAPVTGNYEFIVRSEQAVRLWMNNNKQALIDRWVKSGSDSEFRESIFLLGGRTYPIKLEFTKSKQGVDDTKKNAPKAAQSSIALLWQLPGRGTPEVITARHLTTAKFPETFVVQTPFPPDDRSAGYERGSFITKEWDAATTDAALEIAALISKRANDLAFTRDNAGDRGQKLQSFCTDFAERAFRHPLSDEDKQLYIERQFANTENLDNSVKRSVILVLKSPRFLFHQAASGSEDQYAVAERIALALWDSVPDRELMAAAKAGKLKTRDEVKAQVERMANHPRTTAKLRDFFVQWLRLDHVTDLAKDPNGFPDFNAEIATDLRTSLDISLDEVIKSSEADYRQLMLADNFYLNGRLAKFYGADLPEDAPFTKVALDAGERAGVISHPLLMSSFAYTSTSSPIHRGVFIARSVLGRGLKPPPEAVAPLAPDLHADLNTRERVSLQTKEAVCQTCHGMINPLGFTFERFDAVGRFRKEEKGRAVDAKGSYELRSGEVKNFEGVRPLAEFLANSEESHNAFVTQLFHYTVKQPIAAYGPQALPELRDSFTQQEFNIRKLLIDIVVRAALQEAPASKGT